MKQPPFARSTIQSRVLPLMMATAALTALAAHPACAATPTELLSSYSTQAGSAPVPARGQQFFNARHGREWSCASCHGADLQGNVSNGLTYPGCTLCHTRLWEERLPSSFY